MTRILVVEDEPAISTLVRRGLTAQGWESTVVEDGEEGLTQALGGDFDLVILDVGLPSLDGLQVVRRLRGQGLSLPVIMLTAFDSPRATIEGLDAGASDYVAKPFVVAELMARVRSRLRESTASGPVAIVRDDVSLDMLTRRATVNGREVDLSAREFALADQLMRNAGEVLSREVLLSRVWGLDFDPGSNVVDVYIRYLRGKLGAEHILTVRGEGYRWG